MVAADLIQAPRLRIRERSGDRGNDQGGERDVDNAPAATPAERGERDAADGCGRNRDDPVGRIVDYRTLGNHRPLRTRGLGRQRPPEQDYWIFIGSEGRE
jgi:hypothetical protein